MISCLNSDKGEVTMKRFKNFLVLCCCVIVLGSVTACGTENSNPAQTTDSTKEDESSTMNGATDGNVENGTSNNRTDDNTKSGSTDGNRTNDTTMHDNSTGNVLEDVTDGVTDAVDDTVDGVDRTVEDATHNDSVNGK